jgi:hypothetical protein
MATELKPKQVRTGKVRFSYLNVWKPKAMVEGAEPKYSVALLIPKKDKATVDAIKKATEHVEAEVKAKNKGKLPPKWKTPLRDGDEEKPDDEAYAGHYFINANNKKKPGVVDATREPILDEGDVYSGCYGRAFIAFFSFDTAGNRGVGCSLEALQKLEDGEPFGSAIRAENAFDDVDDLL